MAAKNERSLDHVPESSETPAAVKPSSVYKNPVSTGLEENNIEQPIEQHTSQGNKERQLIPNKPSQSRNMVFPLRHFGNQNVLLIRNGLISLNSCDMEKTLILRFVIPVQ